MLFFGDAGSFALDLNGDYVVVQGFAWFPQMTLKKWIDSLPQEARDDWREQTFYSYLAILSSSPFSLLLAEFCPHVAGGQLNLSKRFIDHVPLPNLAEVGRQSSELGEVIASLANEGELIHSQGVQRLSLINDLVAHVYGVPITSWPINDK